MKNIVKIKNIYNQNMFVYNTGDSYISEQLKQNKVWEPFETNIFLDLLNEDFFLLDLGANIGWYTIVASLKFTKNSKIISFEPDKQNFELLVHNISIQNKILNISCINKAISDTSGNSNFFTSKDNFGDHRLFSSDELVLSNKIEITSLNDLFINETILPNILKSDTQGSEFKILKGSSRLFEKKWRPLMFLEYWPYGIQKSGETPIEMIKMILNYDYEIFQIHEEYKKLILLDFDSITNMEINGWLNYNQKGFLDLLCVYKKDNRFEKVLSYT